MKISIFLTLIILISGCATKPSEGSRVFITATDSAHLSNCKMLGQVEIDASVFALWNANEQIKEIKYRLRDAAAKKYPFADTVTHSDLNVNFFSGPDTNIMGTVFRCF